MRIFEEINTDWFYMNLNMFKKGLIDKTKLMDDEYVFEVRDNGIIVLRFDETSDFFKLFDLSSYDVNTASQLHGSYYYEPEFFDSYSAYEDWKEGYVINYFNTTNIEKLDEITKYIAPNLSVNDDDDRRQIAKLLNEMFNRDMDYIISDYANEINSAMIQSVREDITNEYCEIFQKEQIYKIDCFYKYITTVDTLIKLYESLNCKSESLYEMLQKLGHEKHVNGDFSGSIYETDYWSKFDSNSFNNSATRHLDDVLEKILDSDEFTDITEYRNIISKLTKKFEFNKWFIAPKSRTNYPKIKIMGVDPQTNYINIQYKKDDDEAVKGSVSIEQFNNLLYHPELF
jgi:hypothetical protein